MKEFLPYDVVRNDALKLAHKILKDDFIFVNNYGNHAGEKRFDYQLVLGAKFNFSL